VTEYRREDPVTQYQREDPVTEYQREDGASTSLGSALRDVTSDISTLVQQELALAKAEFRQSATRTGQSVGMFAGAALAAYFFVLFLSIALWWAIGDATGLGVSAIIVAAIWLVAAIVLALVARAQLKKIQGLEQTADTLGKVPNALKGQEELNR
jgi:uncharacterized membrane protein YqjE